MEKFYKKDGKLHFQFKRGLFEFDDVASESHKKEYRTAYEAFQASEVTTTEDVKEAVKEASKPSPIERLIAKVKKPKAKSKKEK